MTFFWGADQAQQIAMNLGKHRKEDEPLDHGQRPRKDGHRVVMLAVGQMATLGENVDDVVLDSPIAIPDLPDGVLVQANQLTCDQPSPVALPVLA